MTCGNLLCGCLGILQTMQGSLATAAWLILLAMVLDFGDGFVARLVSAQSPIGKELDSLADMVTFGALPALMMFELLGGQRTTDGSAQTSWIPYLALSLAVFSALRLAKFNIDTRQSDSFIGVPTPANALVIASLPLMADAPAFLGFEMQSLFLNRPFWIGYTLLMSYLMVAELPLFALKFKSFGWQANRIKYIFLLLSALLLLFLQFAAVPLVIFLYILFSLIFPKGGTQ